MFRFRLVLAAMFLSAGLLALLSAGGAQVRTAYSQSGSRVFLPFVAKSPYTETFPQDNPLILGTCSPQVHDRYSAVGPDGRTYRTWHPVTVPINPSQPNGPKCSFAHEHGDPPHPQGPLPAFGYASAVAGMLNEITAHAGFKVFTHYANGNSGLGYPESDYGGLPIDFTLTIHQGSAGRGRLTTQHHSMEFWSRYQGRPTHVFVMADTGGLDTFCGGGPSFARVVVDHCQIAYEMWPFSTNIGGAWNTGSMFAAVTNPMNHIHGSGLPCADAACSNLTLAPTSEEFCFLSTNPCYVPFGSAATAWLGHFRTIHEPDWEWRNAGQAEVFCTTAMGARVACGAGTIQQQVAAVNLSNAQARLLLRVPDAQGWAAVYNLPVGAPGGN